MREHKHEWVLAKTWDSSKKKYPLNTEFDYRIALLDIIQEPTYTSETWACHCGETKTNVHKHSSLSELTGDK